MTWLRLMLGRLWHNGNGTADVRERAERERDAAHGRRPTVDRAAARLAKLPPDEFAKEVAKVFSQRRHA